MSTGPEVASLAIVGIAAVVTYGLTFKVRSIATDRGLIVMPDPKRVHTWPTPTAGGAAMALGFVIAILVAGLFGAFHPSLWNPPAPLGVVAAVVVMCLLGLIDDVRGVSPPAKVAGQVLAAMVLYFFGVTLTQVKVPFAPGYIVLSSAILPLVTALWVVGIANAVNLIDGLDGLAAGVVAIGSGAMCIYGLRLVDLGVLPSDNIGPLLAAACCGVSLGFLPHNFHRAKIFMGDTGAMVLGLLMAASTMEIGGQAPYVVSGTTYFFFAPLLVPIAILGVPLLDVALAVIRRSIHRTGVTERDLGHIHYRLLRLGHGQRRAVIVLWTWTFLLSGIVLWPTFYPGWNVALPFGVAVLVVALFTLFHPGWRHREALATGAADLARGGGPSPTDPLAAVPGPTTGPLGAVRDGERPSYHRAHSRRFARHRPPMGG